MSNSYNQNTFINIQMPEGHEHNNNKNKEQCPFFVELKNKSEKQKNKMEGCPVFIQEEKKNPALDIDIQQSFNIKYQSPFEIFLEDKGILSLQKCSIYQLQSRKIFDSYPYYLKHSLFHDDETMKKAQKLVCSQRFFIYDVYKERGNEEFNKKNYEQALIYYERTLAIYKWLEYHKQEEIEQKENNQQQEPFTQNEFNFTQDELQKAQNIVYNFKKQKQSKIINYNDSNVILKNGSEIIDTQEQSVRNQKIQESYLLIAIAFMKMFNFKNAQNVLTDALQISEKYSQIYFRLSQAITYDNFSDYNELLYALKCIEKAIEIKKTEQIYQVYPHIIKLLNLQNHEETYQKQLIFSKQRIEQRKHLEINRITRILVTVKEQENLRQKLIDSGRTFPPVKQQEDYRENMHNELIQLMFDKYYNSLIYFEDQKQMDKIETTKKEVQNLSITKQSMNLYQNINFEDNNELLIQVNQQINLDLNDQRIQNRLKLIKNQFIKKEFEKNNFDYQVYMFCLEQFIKDKEGSKKKEIREIKISNQKSKKLILSIFCPEFAIIAILMLIGYLWVVCHYKGYSPIQEFLFVMKQYHYESKRNQK